VSIFGLAPASVIVHGEIYTSSSQNGACCDLECIFCYPVFCVHKVSAVANKNRGEWASAPCLFWRARPGSGDPGAAKLTVETGPWDTLGLARSAVARAAAAHVQAQRTSVRAEKHATQE